MAAADAVETAVEVELVTTWVVAEAVDVVDEVDVVVVVSTGVVVDVTTGVLVEVTTGVVTETLTGIEVEVVVVSCGLAETENIERSRVTMTAKMVDFMMVCITKEKGNYMKLILKGVRPNRF